MQNGNKYITHTIFWPIIGACFGFILIISGFLYGELKSVQGQLLTYKDEVFEKISLIEVNLAIIQTKVVSIEEKLNNYELVE